MENRTLPLWKAIESPLVSLDESHVELFSLLCLFLLGLVALSVRSRHRQLVRRLVQAASVAVFFFVVYSCLGVFGMIRNAIHGTTLIGTAYTEAFFWMSLPLVVIGFSVTTGPFFCGWICPTGTFQELAALARRAAGRLGGGEPPRPVVRAGARSMALLLLLSAAFVAGVAALGSVKPFFVEDASLFWGAALLALVLLVLARRVDDGRIRAIRGISFAVIVLSALLKTTIVSPVHFAFANVFDPASGLTTLVLVLASLFVSRAWCRYLCPWGFLMGWVHGRSRLQLRTGAGCRGCGVCDRVCAAGAIRRGAVRGSSCQFCLACVDRCPRRAIEVVDTWAAGGTPSRTAAADGSAAKEDGRCDAA